jgi:DNA-binding transcriptional MocR family regulator
MAAAMKTISFARGVPAPECIPEDELADCARTVLEREGRTILNYGSAAGYTPLRELIGQWFGVHPGRVILTNGGLQGLVFLGRHLARGKNVIVEYPTYDRALRVLLDSGASLLAAVVDDDGVNPDDLEIQFVGQSKAAFVYLIPTFQNPTGRTLIESRRGRIVQQVMQRDVLLVEDDPYALVRFDGEALPALFDYTGKQGIYMSSFSKTIAPGLRVGWMIVPDHLAAELTEVAAATYITPNLLSQAIVHEFIARGSFEPNLERIRGLLRTRRDAMADALDRHFPGATWTKPEGGYFVWLELPGRPDSREVLKRAEGVTAVPGSDFSAPAYYVRLAYSFVDPGEIDEGVARLAAAMPEPDA